MNRGDLKFHQLGAVSVTLTDTTAIDVIAAAPANFENVILSMIITNQHATTASEVFLTDGSTTIWGPHYAAATGGGYTMPFMFLRGGDGNPIQVDQTASGDITVSVTYAVLPTADLN